MFAQAHWLFALWLLPLLVGLLVGIYWRRQRRLQQFAQLRLDELLNHTWLPYRAWLKAFLLLGTFILLVFALARPRWGFQWRDVPQGGIDTLLVVDLSTSMLAGDIKPSRLERAKREISDLLDLLEGDRIGIVAFAGSAFVQCPLTSDYRMARLFVEQLNTELMPLQGTVIGEALRLATKTLTQAANENSQGKAIVLITDGEDHHTDPLSAAQEAHTKGIKIFPIGIGSLEGAPVPEPDGGFKKDANGKLILSNLDEKTLTEIAEVTGGVYSRATAEIFDLKKLYHSEIRGGLVDAEYGQSRQKIWHERFPIFLLCALLLLLAEFFLSEFRSKNRAQKVGGSEARRVPSSGKILQGFVVGFVLLLVHSSLWAADAGTTAFQQKKYKEAAQQFLDTEIDQPNQAEPAYNRAVSQFKAGDFSEAAEGFRKSAQLATEPLLKQQSLYNLGNTYVAQGELQKALETYNEALQFKPDDSWTQDNKAWVEKQLAEKQKQKQNQDEQKKEKKKQDPSEGSEDGGAPSSEEKKSSSEKTEQKNQNPQGGSEEEQKNQNPQGGSEEEQKNQNPQGGSEEGGTSSSESEKTSSSEKESFALDPKAAEKLLRSLEENEKVYGIPPKIDRSVPKPTQDW